MGAFCSFWGFLHLWLILVLGGVGWGPPTLGQFGGGPAPPAPGFWGQMDQNCICLRPPPCAFPPPNGPPKMGTIIRAPVLGTPTLG